MAAAVRRYQSASRSLDLIRTGVVDETEAGFSITQLAYRLGNARLVDVIVQQRSLIDAQLAELLGAEPRRGRPRKTRLGGAETTGPEPQTVA